MKVEARHDVRRVSKHERVQREQTSFDVSERRKDQFVWTNFLHLAVTARKHTATTVKHVECYSSS